MKCRGRDSNPHGTFAPEDFKSLKFTPAAAFSRAVIAESRRKSGIDCRFAASFASTPRSIETPG